MTNFYNDKDYAILHARFLRVASKCNTFRYAVLFWRALAIINIVAVVLLTVLNCLK